MSNNNSDLIYWLAWLSNPKIGPSRFALLRRSFTTMQAAWQASSLELKQAGLESELINNIINYRAQTDPADLMAKTEQLKIKLVTIAEADYPKLLKEIYDPPPLLFYKGSVAAWQNNCLGVVGTRRATAYGLRVTSDLTKDLALAGLTIVSGLAYGIDTAAHQATLEVSGQTIAVLASGLDTIYPAANRQLANKIISQGGALISEFPLAMPPLKQNFPYRNRLIAGLSRGVLVCEATVDSGALITAKLALESGRDVFAVPGSIYSEQAQGSNELLKLGSHLVTKAADVLNLFGLDSIAPRPLPKLTAEQEKFLSVFSLEPENLDDLIRQSGLSAGAFMAQLTELELAGWVKEVSPRGYVRRG
ncbi:MAG: DNA-protecting protein DprA [Candidatus Kerfeldbacteria bacterium]|nr:DNA-protecting protein DprA [Candidatus Kerfeldbacteria bacterium]